MKRYSLLKRFVVFVLAAAIIFIAPVRNVYAAISVSDLETYNGISYYDAKQRMYAKLYLNAISYCHGVSKVYSEKEKVYSYDLWNSTFTWWTNDLADGDGANPYYESAILDSGVDDKVDKKLYCDKETKWLKIALDAIGVSLEELICNYASPNQAGIFKAENGQSCQVASSLESVGRDDADKYLEKLFKHKYGSDVDPWSFTNAEKYWLYLETLSSDAGSCKLQVMPSDFDYTGIDTLPVVIGFDEGGMPIYGGVISSGEDNDSFYDALNGYEDYVWQGHDGSRSENGVYDVKCGDMVDVISSIDSKSLYKNAQNVIFAGQVESCNGAYADLVNENEQELEAYKAKGDASADEVAKMQEEINKLKAEKKPWAVDSTSGVTCPGVSGWVRPDLSPKTSQSSADCYSASKSFGWVICPVLDGVSTFAESAYSNFIAPHLEIDTLLIGGKDDARNTATYDAWEIFRDIANAFFGLLLLLVIFSQVTGYGIDNYGLKRMLPRLIAMAILVNFSFIVCQIAVDLSNIIGASLHSLLSGLIPDTSKALNSAIAVTGTAVVAISLIVGIVAAIGGFIGWASLVPVVLAVLSGVIAIIFLIILLIVRKAGVIALVVVSPVALAMYILPNTKKIFDKWLKAFEGLLLLYPICSFVIGVGDFVAKLILRVNPDDIGMVLAAVVVDVVPIFFIPTLLKRSFVAMGNIGTRVASVGHSFGRYATGKARDSKVAKNFTEYANNETAARRARRISARLTKKQESGKLSSYQQRKLNSANELLNQYTTGKAASEAGVPLVDEALAKSREESRADSQEFRNFSDQFGQYDVGRLRVEADNVNDWYHGSRSDVQRARALIGALEANGQQNVIYKMLKANENLSRNDSIAQSLAGSKDRVLRAFGKGGFNEVKNTRSSFAEFLSSSGPATLRNYMEKKGSDFLNDIDDKSLGIIANDNPSLMSVGMLMEAASKVTSQDAVDFIDKMIDEKKAAGEDFSGSISGAQLVNFNDSTWDRVKDDISVGVARTIVDSPELYAKLSEDRRTYIDEMIRRDEEKEKAKNHDQIPGQTGFDVNGNSTIVGDDGKEHSLQIDHNK